MSSAEQTQNQPTTTLTKLQSQPQTQAQTQSQSTSQPLQTPQQSTNNQTQPQPTQQPNQCKKQEQSEQNVAGQTSKAQQKQSWGQRHTIPSKKIQINSIDHELVSQFAQQMKDKVSTTTTICIQGNSYSLDFCRDFAGKYLAHATQLENLDINDIFVARSKEEIPASIEAISKALALTQLKNLDISHNAVNPYGAKALLNFLNTAKSLQVFLISNCGLGPLGVAQIAKGLQGTPNLRVFSIGRNRMENAGILSLSESMKFVPKLEELFVYQNTLRKQGLSKLFLELRTNCKQLSSFDLCDNFVREEATEQLYKLLEQNLQLKNLNLSDCLNEGENEKVVQAFENTKNRQFTRLGFNYIELQEDLAMRLLEVLKKCPLKRLDILGNDFPKKVKKAYSEAFPEAGILSRFQEDEDEEQEITRLFEQLKI